MRSLLDDARFALRSLRKNPVIALVALLSLAIGIGANSAIFTLMDQVLLRALPVAHPEQLVSFESPGPLAGFVNTNYGPDVSFSYPDYRRLRDEGTVLDGVIARFPFTLSVSQGGQTEQAAGELVSGNYFRVLGVQPALGRSLTAEDDRAPGAHPVAMLSYGYWMRRFGGSTAVLNQTVTCNGQPMTIVGVAARGFRSVAMGEAPDVFAPMAMKKAMTPTWDELANSHAYWLNIFGRLKPGVPRERAETAMNVTWHALLQDGLASLPISAPRFRAEYLAKRLKLAPSPTGISGVRELATRPLQVLLVMTGLVLLIACANVASLLLARAAAREREIAIRLSLGATRWHIVRQTLAESVLLSFAGGALGVAVASGTGRLILHFLPAMFLQGLGVAPDARMLGFTFAVAIVTGLLFGLAPALRASRPDLAPALKAEASTVSGGGHVRLRKALVSVQMAVSVVLLAGAALFAQSMYNLHQLNPGFRVEHVLTFSVDPSLLGYSSERARDFGDRLQREIGALPGTIDVSMARMPLVAGAQAMSGMVMEGYHPSEGENMTVSFNAVGTRYFATMGIPLLAGREFAESDRSGSPPVAVINETAAKRYFGDRNPIGLHLGRGQRGGQETRPDTEIVGVAKNAKYDRLREKPKPFVYFATDQEGDSAFLAYYVRTAADPLALAGPVRRVVQRLDANLPVTDLLTMREQVDQSVFLSRLIAMLSCAFAATATLLACVGLYGVVAWSVTRRTREIGIRIALGALSADVIRMVMRDVVVLGAIGVAVALPAWFAVSRLVQSQLFGVSARDPLAIAVSIVALALAALLAGLIPALRAARVDPMLAIRYE
ncbi:MAG: ABC transporter permease [Bryobacteraceae bacterium]|jgi:predicted permease